MRFSWNNFDESFLKEIISATDDVEDKERYLATDDSLFLFKLMCDKELIEKVE